MLGVGLQSQSGHASWIRSPAPGIQNSIRVPHAWHGVVLGRASPNRVTLCLMQALLSFTSEARWLRHARAHLRHLFPYLPQQPGYNKRLRKPTGAVNWLIRQLAADTSAWTDDVWVVDSIPIECARSRDTVRRSDLAGRAQYGYCASHSRYFWACACTWSPPCTACRSRSR